LSSEDERLGMSAEITRRDILNSRVIGQGQGLLSAQCPAAKMAPREDFTGYGGVGDYARANGNTYEVLTAAHKVRDGYYQAFPPAPPAPQETYDLVIVGGGLAGLMAAWEYRRLTGGKRTVLILDNAAMFGGEARENDFEVNGTKLIAPQGSNQFGVARKGSNSPMEAFFNECNLPYEHRFQDWSADLKPLKFTRDNYGNMDGQQEQQVDIGYWFDGKPGQKGRFVNNIWKDDLARTPFSPKARADLLDWRKTRVSQGDAEMRALDKITYKDWIEKVKGWDPAVTDMAEPLTGLLSGISADASPAWAGRFVGDPKRPLSMSYPGGNSTWARHLVRSLIPESFPGPFSFDNLMTAQITPAALDRAGSPVRLRMSSMAIDVRHSGPPGQAESVVVTYMHDGQPHAVKGSSVVMATGGWINKRIIQDLPREIVEAYDQYTYAPALIINVALTNWRFMYNQDITAVRWFGDEDAIGFWANLRRSMVSGGYEPPLDPDKPTVLSFYMGLYTRGRSAFDQGALGRLRLLSTSYSDYERIVRKRLAMMFADVGFDPKRDIAGITLNRWGHARLVEPVGFHFGSDGKPSPLQAPQKGFGRIFIGHAELNGSQHASTAFEHGRRAAAQAFGVTG
jgi:spermidine dehydrogenase